MSYDHKKIEEKWQQQWSLKEAFKTQDHSSRPKYYVLTMFPYPSGSGLHIGHLACYTPTDVMARFKRAQGYNVLNPIGYDAFGLPAEQYAIKTGVHPEVTTRKAIDNFRRQMQSFGVSFDWSREISTCDPEYYKWTQYFFTLLFQRGLAYQKEVPVNWCPALKTVLANEEVIEGKSERGGHPVVRMPMKQWMLKITDYAERLLQDLEQVDWPERTKEGQRNWIGKSFGAEVQFSINQFLEKKLLVFTTRPDTLFGVTFMVLSPEHPLIEEFLKKSELDLKEEKKNEIKHYQEASARKSEVDRKANTEKTGVFTGVYALHPYTKERIPIWISDYVFMDYGTGAIMAVPGHDERDFEFAQKFQLPIVRVLEGGDLPFLGEGVLVNSGFLSGLNKSEAIEKMIEDLEKRQIGKKLIQYKLRDWLFSRQRYWGEPFPIVYDKEGNKRALPLEELPVKLPEVADYEPSEKGEAPLARATEWVQYKASKPSSLEKRETDTMPGSAGSSWYYLRYTDPHNTNQAFQFEKQKYWLPVDLYIGGSEHTVGHLLYSRFWHKVFFDAGLVSTSEPFKKLFHQGIILGPDGERMSKSRGNVVNPDAVRDEYGADVTRTYLSFLGPTDKDKPWSTNGIDGVRRFLERIWRLVFNESSSPVSNEDSTPPSLELKKALHKTIKKVTEDIESMNHNTAISAMMIFVNEFYRLYGDKSIKPMQPIRVLSQLLMPFAPHFSEEIWSNLGGDGFVSLQSWPTYDPELTKDDLMTLAVQVNGKMRGTIQLAPDAEEKTALDEALKNQTVCAALGLDKGESIKKVIYKAGKILNIISSK